jgi:hypothetical protein
LNARPAVEEKVVGREHGIPTVGRKQPDPKSLQIK